MEDTIKISRTNYEATLAPEIVEFLNRAYPSTWGDLENWNWCYNGYPTFKPENAFILTSQNKIVGFRGLFFRQLIIPGTHPVPTVSFGSTAVHPDYRKHNVYSRMHEETIELARKNGAALAFTWNQRGGITHRHNLNTGFAEVQRVTSYYKILNYENVFNYEIKKFLIGNEAIRKITYGVENNLYLGMGDSLWSVGELMDKGSKPADFTAKGKVKIIFSPNALRFMLAYSLGKRLQKIQSILLLVFSGRMRIYISSPRLFAKIVWRAVKFGI